MKILPVLETFHAMSHYEFKFHMTYIIEGNGALVNKAGEETPLKDGSNK